MALTHFQILALKDGTGSLQIRAINWRAHDVQTYCVKSGHLCYICALAGSLLSIWVGVNRMTVSSPPAAAPPTSDNNSASAREQVHITCVTALN